MSRVHAPRVLLLALALLLLPGAALAAKGEPARESKKFMSGGLNVGWLWLQDSNVQAVYSDKARFVTQLKFGVVPWSKYIHVEIDGSFGFSQFTGTQRFVTGGGASADSVMLTLFPFGVDLLVGIDIAFEQPVVPYGGVGLNWTVFREHDSGSKWNGYRLGPSAFFGAAILLDSFEHSRAAALDSKTGINDAFLTIEGRYNGARSIVDAGALRLGAFGLQGWQLSVGIKLVI